MRKALFLAAALALGALATATLSQAQPYGPGMMNGWGSGYGYGPVHMLIWVVILIAVVALVVWLVRSIAPGAHHALPRRSGGLDVLEERYARGEINRDEYLQKKKDIGG
jgi:putative membrane protein